MKKGYRIIYWFPLIGAALFCAGMWLGYLLSPRVDLTPSQRKMLEVFDLINEEYVDEVAIDSLVETTIPEILRNLDPHSAYISAEDLERVSSELEASFGGIGIQFQMPGDTVTVVEVIAGSPAHKAGLLPGDRIISVDNKDIAGKKMETDEIFSLLRGRQGTKVALDIKRPGQNEILKFTITRGDIPQPSIEGVYMTPDSIGYIRVSKFARDTYEQFYKAMVKLKLEDGAKSFIVDLRGNTGGYMEPAVMMANEFLEPGNIIVETRGRNASDNSIIEADGTGLFQDTPLTVLIDEISASASEIFSGAMQDNDRALIIGRRSFGKGLVQKPILLADSSEIRLTVQRYYTPSGRCIQKDYSSESFDEYESEIYRRYLNGEVFGSDNKADSLIDKSLIFHTANGRKVYGGGGISPDVFVPTDSIRRNTYYVSVVNRGLINTYAYEYVDLNREELSKYRTVEELLRNLDNDYVLLNSFVRYAVDKGVRRRPYYIEQSAPLIVNQLKALIVRYVLGFNAFYSVYNQEDEDVKEAIRLINKGMAEFPVTTSHDKN
ncbi:MAG: S41 family peptidase [Muribaculaceae bacterium]|nr:S41 family peptidase [Muribaculaceae bacterium]